MTLRKLQNTGHFKRKCWMAVSLEYALKEAMVLPQNMLRYNDND